MRQLTLILLILSALLGTVFAQNYNVEVYSELGDQVKALNITQIDNGSLRVIVTVDSVLNSLIIDDAQHIISRESFTDFKYQVMASDLADDGSLYFLYATKGFESDSLFIAKLNQNFQFEYKLYADFENPPNEGLFNVYSNSHGVLFGYENIGTYTFTKIDDSGKQLWQSTFTEIGFRPDYIPIIELHNGDYLLGTKKTTLRIDSLGNTLWSHSWSRRKPRFAELTDGSILICDKETITKLSSTGDEIKEIGIEDITDKCWLVATEDNGLLMFSSYPKKLSKYNSELNIIWSRELNHSPNEIKIINNNFIATGEYANKLLVCTSSLEKINKKYLSLLEPNGSELLLSPQSHSFDTNWVNLESQLIDSVVIEYSQDNGLTWQQMALSSDFSTRYYYVNEPIVNSDECLIRIYDSSDPSYSDISRNAFSTRIYNSTDYIACNEIFMWIGNNGMSAHDPVDDDSGMFWPGGEYATISSVFSDGIVWGCKVDNEIRVNGSTYRYGLVPGAISVDGTPMDNYDPAFQVFKLKKNWQALSSSYDLDKYEYNYNNWPAQYGAPYIDINNDGAFTRGVDEPEVIGDETLFYVANDLDTAQSKSTFGSDPIGLEFQQTVFAYDTPELKDAVFKKVRIINKSDQTLEEMYVSYWADDDMGFAGDDFIGCDTLLKMGYTYNGDNLDEDYYGEAPPAIGRVILKGPLINGNTLNLASFTPNFKNYANLPNDPNLGGYKGSIEFYNIMHGLSDSGDSIISPITNKGTIFPLCGDPVTGTGWYEGNGWPDGPPAADRRYTMSSGPFSLQPNETQEVVYAIFMARGTDNINSVAKLKEKARELHEFWGNEIPTDVSDNATDQLPEQYSLSQNYPNPFNPTTTIEYTIPASSSPLLGEPVPIHREVGGGSRVRLIVYDILGREVATLVNENQKPGSYKVQFNASKLASGVYFYTLFTDSFTKTRKLLLLK